MNKNNTLTLKSEIFNSSVKDASLLVSCLKNKNLESALLYIQRLDTSKKEHYKKFFFYIYNFFIQKSLPLDSGFNLSIETKNILKRYRIRAKGRIFGYKKKYIRLVFTLRDIE